jgi:hypothetical protein
MAAPLVHWPQGATANVEIFWRWLHIVSAILWIGFLYFFNLVSTQFAAALDPGLRPRVLPRLMWRALNWFRWSSLVAVLSGFAYFGQIAGAEAKNGNGNAGAFFLSWLVIWVVVWIIFYALLRAGNKPLLYLGTALVMIAASWLFLHGIVSASERLGNRLARQQEDPALDGIRRHECHVDANESNIARASVGADLPLQLLSDIFHHLLHGRSQPLSAVRGVTEPPAVAGGAAACLRLRSLQPQFS